MTQLAYPRIYAPRVTFIEELKEILRATPLAIFLAALRERR